MKCLKISNHMDAVFILRWSLFALLPASALGASCQEQEYRVQSYIPSYVGEGLYIATNPAEHYGTEGVFRYGVQPVDVVTDSSYSRTAFGISIGVPGAGGGNNIIPMPHIHRCGNQYEPISVAYANHGPPSFSLPGTLTVTLNRSGTLKLKFVVLDVGTYALPACPTPVQFRSTYIYDSTYHLEDGTTTSFKEIQHRYVCGAYQWEQRETARSSGPFVIRGQWFDVEPRLSAMLTYSEQDEEFPITMVAAEEDLTLQLQVSSNTMAPAQVSVHVLDGSLPSDVLTLERETITEWQSVDGQFVARVNVNPKEIVDWPQVRAKPVEIRIVQDGVLSKVPLEVRARPLALLHGLWSGGTAWDFARSVLELGGAPASSVLLVDYQAFNASSFTSDQLLAHVAGQLRQERHRLLREGIVVDSFDMVGHSMGGLVAKMLATRNPGTVNRLIAVGSPFEGSPLAALLADNRGTLLTPSPLVALFGGTTLAEFLQFLDMRVTCPEPVCAVDALRPGSSQLFQTSQSLIPVFGVRGSAPYPSLSGDLIQLMLSLFSNANLTTLLGVGNDTIVPLHSQNFGALAQVDITAVHADTPLNKLVYALSAGLAADDVETSAAGTINAIDCYLYVRSCQSAVVKADAVADLTAVNPHVQEFLSVNLANRVRVPANQSLTFNPPLPTELVFSTSRIFVKPQAIQGSVERVYNVSPLGIWRSDTGFWVYAGTRNQFRVKALVLLSGNRYTVIDHGVLRIPAATDPAPTLYARSGSDVIIATGDSVPLAVDAEYRSGVLDVSSELQLTSALAQLTNGVLYGLTPGSETAELRYGTVVLPISLTVIPGKLLFANGFE